jgi:nitroreductase
VVLVYVADYAKMTGRGTDDKHRVDCYAYGDTCFISQNVYLFCASEGLSTVVLGNVDREALERALDLPMTRKVIYSQPVAFKKQ